MAAERKDTETPTSGGGSNSTERALYVRLIRAATRLEAELNRLFRPMQLTGATYNILRILESAGITGRSCGDISEELIAEVPDMTRLLDRLERLGYVVRARSSVDRRMVTVTITESGRAVLAQLEAAVEECHARQFRSLGESGLVHLRQELDLILERLEGLESPRESPSAHTPKHHGI